MAGLPPAPHTIPLCHGVPTSSAHWALEMVVHLCSQIAHMALVSWSLSFLISCVNDTTLQGSHKRLMRLCMESAWHKSKTTRIKTPQITEG